MSTNFTFLDPKLTQNYCGQQSGVTNCPTQDDSEPFLPGDVLVGPQAPTGTNLPVTPKFKGNIVARYTFSTFDGWAPFGQAAFVYQSKTTPLLRVDQALLVGTQPAYGLLDLAAGAEREGLSVQLFVTNVGDRLAQLSRFEQTVPQAENQPYIIPAQPRTFSIRLAQRF